MEISITFNDDLRGFYAGETRTIKGGNVTFIVGKNGCGKSTFMQLLRQKKDSLKEQNRRYYGGMESSVLSALSDADVEIKGLEEYSHCFFLDAVVDNPTSFENAATATGLVGGGGIAMLKSSRGQGSSMLLSRFIRDISKVVPVDGSKSLIVLDEIDEGMDIENQAAFGKQLLYLISETYDADIICITHSVLPILASDEQTVYCFDKGESVTVEQFISDAIDKKIVIA